MTTTDFETLPAPASVRLIDFDDAKVVPGIVPETFILIVNGVKPYLNMDVKLVPLVYLKQPDYWGIEVIGMLNGFGLPAEAPYIESIPLDGIRGTMGIEVIGARKKQKLKVP